MKHGSSNFENVYVDFLAGKAAGATCAEPGGRLSLISLSAPLFHLLFGVLPTAWCINRTAG